MALKAQFDQVSSDFKKDKDFYDKALEARTNQLEELEAENEKLKKEKEEDSKKLEDLHAMLDQMQFDREMD